MRRAPGPTRPCGARARACRPGGGCGGRSAATESGHAGERARHAQALVASVEPAAAVEAQARLESLRLEREAVDRGLAGLTGGSGETPNRALVALGAARERIGALS